MVTVFATAVMAMALPPSFYNCTEQGPTAFAPVTISNSHGMSATMIAYGATMTHLMVPDRAGTSRDVVLGWDDLTQYCANPEHTYFGATIGRVANRVANCSFDLGGKTYKLSCNEKGYDTLHGGAVGFDRRVWTASQQSSSSVTWNYFSPDGEMGFPGSVNISVTHAITEDNEWKIQYHAVAGDSPTVLAMTNHAYFNLNANADNTATTMEHVLSMPGGKKRLGVSGAPDYHLIPTGERPQSLTVLHKLPHLGPHV